MEETKKTIRQIVPIEPGWTCKYLSKYKNEFTIHSIPVTGQALVEWTYPDGETAFHVEAICFDDGCFLIEPDLPSYDAENTFHIGLRPPGDAVDGKELEDFKKALLTKMVRKAAKAAA